MSGFRYPAAMKSLASVVFSLFFTGFSAAAPPTTDSHPARVVQLLNLDFMISAVFNRYVQESFAAGRVTAAQAACLKTGPADFTQELASVARRELTAEELATAVAYLSSSDGRKFGEQIAAYANDPPSDLDLNTSEAAAFAKFMETSAGKKLTDTDMLMKSDSYGELIDAKARQIKAKCNAPQRLNPANTPLNKKPL